MLYIGCSCCRAIGPFLCGGQMWPHPPLVAFSGPGYVACPQCGPMTPTFTCLFCGMYQMLYVPGARPPLLPAYPGMASPRMAPVFQAQQNASPDMLQTACQAFVKGVASQLGQELVSGFFGEWG